MILKRGMIGKDVASLISSLTNAGFAPISGPGSNFNSDVENAVKAFQSNNIGPNHIPLVVDGEAGPLTLWALEVAESKIATPIITNQPINSTSGKPSQSSTTGWNALQIAIAELNANAGETTGDNNGPDIKRYHAVTGANPGDAWCASFVSYCFSKGNPGSMPFSPTAGARNVLEQFKKKGWDYSASTSHPPAPGDVIVWWRGNANGWLGHVGIVAEYANGLLTTIEGNRGAFPSKVNSFRYTLGQIDRLLGFGRSVP